MLPKTFSLSALELGQGGYLVASTNCIEKLLKCWFLIKTGRIKIYKYLKHKVFGVFPNRDSHTHKVKM